jgi:PTH1 family peptidyl-tRNA hydrolase
MPSPIRLVVGLGNPGLKYEHTRHNVGFEVLDRLAKDANLCFKRSFVLRGLVATWQSGPSRVRLLKPQTYMNASGLALRRAMKRDRLAPEQVLVVYDDVELPVGTLRLRKQGGAGGHNGMKSIVEALDGAKNFARLRVGVGPRPSGDQLIDYVLGRWPEADADAVEALLKSGAEAVTQALQGSLDEVMNQINAA